MTLPATRAWLPWIATLDHQPHAVRRQAVMDFLSQHQIPFEVQDYATGQNLMVRLGNGPTWVGLASHTDRVKLAGGANDNGSAMAVCLQVLEWAVADPASIPNLMVFFFDEEETGLLGSQAWVKAHGVRQLTCLLNLELMGMGDRFGAWQVAPTGTSRLLRAVHESAAQCGTEVHHFHRIVTNTADHVSFYNNGLHDTFSLTCISPAELSAYAVYAQAVQRHAPVEELLQIMQRTPLFQHYHRESDTADKLSEAAIALSARVSFGALQRASQ